MDDSIIRKSPSNQGIDFFGALWIVLQFESERDGRLIFLLDVAVQATDSGKGLESSFPPCTSLLVHFAFQLEEYGKNLFGHD